MFAFVFMHDLIFFGFCTRINVMFFVIKVL